MKHEVKKVNDTRHEVTVDVDTVAWKKAQDKAISKLSTYRHSKKMRQTFRQTLVIR